MRKGVMPWLWLGVSEVSGKRRRWSTDRDWRKKKLVAASSSTTLNVAQSAATAVPRGP